MTTKKIYGPWIKWHGGECPVLPDTLVRVKLRREKILEPRFASHYRWNHFDSLGDIVGYCTVTEQADLEAAEKLLRENGYTVTPPAKPLTFEDVVPMTEAPPEDTRYWVPQPFRSQGVEVFIWEGDEADFAALQHRMTYLDKEHALVAARHIFGLKGGEL